MVERYHKIGKCDFVLLNGVFMLKAAAYTALALRYFYP